MARRKQVTTVVHDTSVGTDPEWGVSIGAETTNPPLESVPVITEDDPIIVRAKLAARFGVDLEAILTYTVYDDYVSVVVNRGIAGCPKYRIPLAELEEGGKP